MGTFLFANVLLGGKGEATVTSTIKMLRRHRELPQPVRSLTGQGGIATF